MNIRYLLASRHPGAKEWLARRGIRATVVPHLDVADLKTGDIVIGNLPAHIAASVVSRGARFVHLAMDVPPAMRGGELSADEMDRFGAKLVPLTVIADPRPLTISKEKSTIESTTLVTLLGAPRAGDYDMSTYRFEGQRESARWMPQALIRMIRQSGGAILRVIVVGTRGSGWDLLARAAGLEGSNLEFDLFTSGVSDETTVAVLNVLARHLEAALDVEEVLLLVVPYVDDKLGSAFLVGQLANVLQRNERIIFDVTFGLRDHMLTTFASLLALESLRDIHLDDVIYASIKAQSATLSSIHSISPVREIMNWVRALSVLDSVGDLRPLSLLLEPGAETGKLLTTQQVDERMMRPRKAAEGAKRLLAMAENSLDPTVALFRDSIAERLSWSRAGKRPSAIQAALARRTLADGDWVRATALAFEACVSAFGEKSMHLSDDVVEDPGMRPDIQEALNADAKAALRIGPSAHDQDYLSLKDVRNRLLHATRSNRRETEFLLSNPDKLAVLIDRVLKNRIELR